MTALYRVEQGTLTGGLSGFVGGFEWNTLEVYDQVEDRTTVYETYRTDDLWESTVEPASRFWYQGHHI